MPSSDQPTALGTVVKFSKDSAIGALAAVVAKTLVAPIERVKLILQVCFRLIKPISFHSFKRLK
jgi:hypothetical protein